MEYFLPSFFSMEGKMMDGASGQAPTRMELDDKGSYLLVEDEWDRVMPTVSAVKAARRYDLHHAIDLHGGYRAVAEELGRTRCWPRYPHLRENPGALRQVLKEVALRQGIKQGAIPTKRAFLEAGRTDLYQIVQAEGAPPPRSCPRGRGVGDGAGGPGEREKGGWGEAGRGRQKVIVVRLVYGGEQEGGSGGGLWRRRHRSPEGKEVETKRTALAGEAL
jgi:hypothetical protein